MRMCNRIEFWEFWSIDQFTFWLHFNCTFNLLRLFLFIYVTFLHTSCSILTWKNSSKYSMNEWIFFSYKIVSTLHTHTKTLFHKQKEAQRHNTVERNTKAALAECVADIVEQTENCKMCVDRECLVSSIATSIYLWPEHIFTVASRIT